MTQLDSSIILQAGKTDPLQYGDVMERRAQIQLRNLALAKDQRAEATAAQQQRTLQDVGKLAASGDYAAADKGALESGNFDLHNHIKGLQDEQRAHAIARVRSAVPIAMDALSRTKDPTERAQMIASAAPSLLANGWTQEEIAGFVNDPGKLSDEGLSSFISGARTAEEAFKAYDKQNEGFTLGQDQQRYDGNGKLIATGPESIKAITTPEGGTTTVYGGAGHTGIGTPAFTGHVGPQIEGTISSFIPGVQVTSRQRDPSHNAAVGGVGNSFHLTDNARDFVPPKGMSMVQLASAIKGKLPGYDVLNEGTHVHVEPSNEMVRGGGPITIKGQPKADKSDPTAGKPPSGYRWTPDGNLQPIPGGPGDKGNGQNLKAVPAATVKDYIGNNQSIRQIDRAWTALTKNPKAVGASGYVPDAILKRTDPAGVDARAAVANIGSLLIHDRSGAAVTISETPRLVPFIPQVTDDADTVKKKLRQLHAALTETQADFDSVYSADQGYKPLPKFKQQAPVKTGNQSGPVKIASDADYAKLKSGAMFIGPDGHTRRKP